MTTPQKTQQAPFPNKFGARVLGIFAVVAIGFALVLLNLSGWTAPARARKLVNPIPATENSVHHGMKLYAEHCQSCHGANGDGKGERAEKLSLAPADLTNTQALSTEPDGILFWKISEGHRPMPAYKNKLTETERWELVNYLRTLEKK